MKVASLTEIVRALHGSGVRFIVVGGLAVVAHGYGRQTVDLALVIPLDPESVHALFLALARLDYRPRVPVTAAGMGDAAQRERWIVEKGMKVLSFFNARFPETPVDVFVTEPFDFEREYQSAQVEQPAPGLPFRVVRLATLLRMKAEAGRPQDLADIHELTSIHGEATDDRPG